jgi:predicted nucleotidyltransferase
VTDDRDYLLEPLATLIRLFDEREISYALIGGLAVAVHGIPRPTHDLDFTAAIPRDRLDALYQSATDRGFTVPEVHDSGWVDQVSDMPLIRVRQWGRGEPIDVDIFLAETPFQQSLLERRQKLHVDGIEAWVASPEDLILLKLIAGRPRDIGDVQDILMAQGQLELSYLEHWAARLKIMDRWTETRNLYDEMS